MKTKFITVFIGLLLGFSFLGISSAQEVTVNDDFAIESDGTFRLDNDATVWDDLNVYPDGVSKAGTKDPDYVMFSDDGSSSTGVWLNMFDAGTEEEVYFTVQLPHAYKEGTNLQPHIHWTTITGTPSGTDVVWGLEYTVSSIGGVFSTTTIVQAGSTIAATTPTSAKQHLINAFPEIDGSSLAISSIISCRLFRDAGDGSDTFANEVGLLGFDFHFEQDTQGSRQPFIK